MRPLGLDCLTLPDVAPVELAAIAGEVGFATISLWVQAPALSAPMLATMASAGALRRLLTDTSVSISNLEVFNLNGDAPIADYAPAVALGASLGAATATAIDFGAPREDIAERLAAFHSLCAEHGLATLVEPISMGNICTPADGLALIAEAGVDVRLVIDMLHLVRTGGTAATLAALPADRIGRIQLCDGPATIAPDALGMEATADRLYPGEGAFPLAELLAALPADAPVGVEAPSLTRRLRGESPRERARASLKAARTVLARCGV